MKWKKILFVCLILFFILGPITTLSVFAQDGTINIGDLENNNSNNTTNNTVPNNNTSGTVQTTNSGGGSAPNNTSSGSTINIGNTGPQGDFSNIGNNSPQPIGNSSNTSGGNTDGITIITTGSQPIITGSNGQPAGSPAPTNQGFNYDSCGWGAFDCWIAWFLNNIVLGTAYLFAGIAGFLFDSIIKFSVVDMGKNVQIGQGTYLADAWTIMRDVANIAFIFVLLYVGIMTIIKGFDSGTNKMIATIITIALIINFSLFFTKIIIDASNIIAINFYEAISSQASNGGDWSGIAGVYFEKLHISSVNDAIPAASKDNAYLNIIKISLGGTVIMVILGIVLFIACVMFAARYIVLIFVLVTSAAAIGSWILPNLKKSIYDKWWAALIGQSFFAPIFIFFIWLSLLMTDGMTKTLLKDKGVDWASLFTSPETSIAAVINLVIMYLIVIGFLIGAIIVSKSLSDMAGKGAGQITSMVGSGALSLAGVAGRNTLGRASRRFADSDIVNNFAARSVVGRGLRNTLQAGAKGSFDLRASSSIGKIIGATGVDLGKAGGKGGYAGTLEKQIKAREGFYKDIGEATQEEKLKKDALQSKIDNLDETQKRQKLIKEIKEEEEELKLLKEGTDEHTKAKTDLDAKKEEAGKLKTEINKKSEEWRKSIKEIDAEGKKRSSAYVESFDKLIGNVPKAWVGQKNKLAAVNLRNAKRKEQTDSEKTIKALKDLQKEFKESKKE